LTASCPICGGKWDVEGTSFSIDLRCGDEHDIYCSYCKNTIKFIISRDDLAKANIRAFQTYLQVVKDLERQLEKEKEKN
jgi:hypothetical protein